MRATRADRYRAWVFSRSRKELTASTSALSSCWVWVDLAADLVWFAGHAFFLTDSLSVPGSSFTVSAVRCGVG
jgi:hypothetical protein